MTTWLEIKPTDKFYVNVISTAEELLCIAPAVCKLLKKDRMIIKVGASIYQATGTIQHIAVYQNGAHVADCARNSYATYNVTVFTGCGEPAYFMTVYKEEWFSEKTVEKRCTCGGWAVYGKEADIHSDNLANRCELREP